MHCIKLAGAVIFLAVLLPSCKDKDSLIGKVILTDKQARVIKEFTDPVAINKIVIAWENRKEVVLKRRPDFAYIVQINVKGHQIAREWLYAPPSFVVVKDKPYGVIYKINADEFRQYTGVTPD